MTNMDRDVCYCRCHTNSGVKHCKPCCRRCLCGKHIKFHAWERHQEQCYEIRIKKARDKKREEE